MNRRTTGKGFTLIELLVVIAIIAILAAILFPVYTMAKARGRDARCMSNMRQLGSAFRMYMDNWNGRFIPTPNYMSGQPNAWQGGSFVTVLRSYAKAKDVFLCPSGPNKDADFGGFSSQMNANAKDQGWSWNGERSHYGNNFTLCGVAPNADRQTYSFCDLATDSQLTQPSKIIYLCDSRWVDLFGGWQPGRIGLASDRHHTGGNVVCCDGHATWVPRRVLIAWPELADAPVRWDWRPKP